MNIAIFSHHHLKKGYIALMSVLVIGAVGIAITLSLLLLGLGSSRTSFALEQSNQAKALANACAEDALQKIRDNSTFTGNGNLSLGYGTCSYTVTNTGGPDKLITGSGTVGSIVRKIKITLSGMIITSWQEVAEL